MSEWKVDVVMTGDVKGFARQMAAAGESVATAMHRFAIPFMDKRTGRRHARRCGMCSPMANPKPLGIDGAAFRRKSKRRRGKR